MDNPSEPLFPRPLSGIQVVSQPSGLVPARMPLTGRQVRLEPLDPQRHGDELYRLSHEDETARAIWSYLPQGPWPNRATYLDALRANAADLTRIFYAICPLPHAAPAGQASFMDIDANNGVIEIGYIWFAPALQRTRAATQSLYLMLDYAMSELKYRRMQWRCNALNEKSRAAAKRLGFRFEGIFHNHLIYKGLNRDTAWYSILDDEWPEVKTTLEAWLDDSNFDSSERARHSLREMMDKRGPSRRAT